jgi:2-polyprenyl-3-methyl-5-hydroxy-6-metoxy-1,4-benzoquinol methylase
MTHPAVLPVPEADRLEAFERELQDRYDAEHAGKRLWRGHREWWLEDLGPRHELRLLGFLQRFDHLIGWREKRCLDMGCGSGAALIALTALGAHAIGIDKQAVGADLALGEKRAALYGMTLDVSEGDGTRLTFDDASFDVVYSTSVAEHVKDIRTYLAEAWRVLRPGGWFILSTDNRAALREGHTGLWLVHWLPYATFRALANVKMGKPWNAPLEVYPRSYRFYRRIAIASGFRVEAGRLDSLLLAPPEASSTMKRRIAALAKASHLPLEAFLPGTLIICRKPAI